ncbi:PREDICTED: leucine-rich repeat-containing protein 74A-like isoform X3 [Branchiostoma belcheri]|uniref:Leucine-rich repeat-containing protein 74A-like isoform X3 n=1 Tax=Branchiostoma belcheri TaxID=7741 RepID=A0A6P4ZMI4_BRABE|nr:PREDICTED: leucine-rich repeat-containing protein 74A-like isoform X3 [Branchiostoma belcheri]
MTAVRSTMATPDFDNDLGDSDDYETDLELEEPEVVQQEYDPVSEMTRLYRSVCRRTGVVPASTFLRHLTASELNMDHYGLGPLGTKCIATALKMSTFIETLSLEDNWMTGEGGVYMADMLKENPSITDISNRYLEELNLSGNEFSEVGGGFMGAGIGANETITALNLSWNHLRLKGVFALCRGLRSNNTLQWLDVSWNGFDDEGASGLATVLKYNEVLTYLDLTNNRISTRGAMKMAKALCINKTLHTLKLGKNPIGMDGSLQLLKAVRSNEESGMHVLDLTDVLLSQEFLDLYTVVQQERPHFSVVYGGVGQDLGWMVNDKKHLKRDPMQVFQDYIYKNHTRVITVFQSFNRGDRDRVTREAFKKGIKTAKIPLAPHEIEHMLDVLDSDGDGMISYGDVMAGQKELFKKKREEEWKKYTEVLEERRRRRQVKEKLEGAMDVLDKEPRSAEAWIRALQRMKHKQMTPSRSSTRSGSRLGLGRSDSRARSPSPAGTTDETKQVTRTKTPQLMSVVGNVWKKAHPN